MSIFKNKWFSLAILFFLTIIYGLIFRENNDFSIPTFPHLDKVMHCLLFFGQIWLLARGFIYAQRPIPYVHLLIFALVLAIGTEWAQATFTRTRQADFWDGVADMVGASVALLVARTQYQIQHHRLK